MGLSSEETRDPKLIPHVAGIAEPYSATSSSEHGLTQQEAARHLAQHGANAVVAENAVLAILKAKPAER